MISFFSYRAASIAASAGGADSKRPRALIWPEWNEKDVNDEKWVSLINYRLCGNLERGCFGKKI